MFNPVIRGWIGYFGRYHKSALYPVSEQRRLTPGDPAQPMLRPPAMPLERSSG
jgi:hypothetical protein